MGPDFGQGQEAPFRSTSKMRLLLLLLLGLAVWITFGLISPSKGDMFQLQNMIKNMTGKPITNYISYGCHCGWGGAAKPVDATDWCCHAHDCCYAELGRKSCFAKMKSYNYSTSHGNILCGAGSWCETMSCECDKMLTLCLLKEMDTYDSKYRWYSTSHPCHCRGLTLPCSFAKS